MSRKFQASSYPQTGEKGGGVSTQAGERIFQAEGFSGRRKPPNLKRPLKKSIFPRLKIPPPAWRTHPRLKVIPLPVWEFSIGWEFSGGEKSLSDEGGGDF